MTKEEFLKSPTVHNFAKHILIMSEKFDPVDVLNDLELVHKIIEDELNNLQKVRW